MFFFKKKQSKTERKGSRQNTIDFEACMNLYDKFTSKLKKARNIENIYNRINRTKNTIVSKKDKVNILMNLNVI